jgi:hypothetical protein
MDETKPVLILAKVLKVAETHSRDGNAVSRSLKLLPLGEVQMYPAVSKQQAEREFLALMNENT